MKIIKAISKFKICQCILCSNFVNYNELTCKSCNQKLAFDIHQNFYHFIFNNRNLYCHCEYSDAWKKIIKIFKTQNRGFFCNPMMNFIDDHVKHSEINEVFDYIIPIPSHPLRLISETNFTSAFCKSLAQKFKVPIINDLLNYGPIWQQQQKSKSKNKRHAHKKFFVNKESANKFNNSSILLVDDVITSGTSINSAINELAKSNIFVSSIFVFSKNTKLEIEFEL